MINVNRIGAEMKIGEAKLRNSSFPEEVRLHLLFSDTSV